MTTIRPQQPLYFASQALAKQAQKQPLQTEATDVFFGKGLPKPGKKSLLTTGLFTLLMAMGIGSASAQSATPVPCENDATNCVVVTPTRNFPEATQDTFFDWADSNDDDCIDWVEIEALLFDEVTPEGYNLPEEWRDGVGALAHWINSDRAFNYQEVYTEADMAILFAAGNGELTAPIGQAAPALLGWDLTQHTEGFTVEGLTRVIQNALSEQQVADGIDAAELEAVSRNLTQEDCGCDGEIEINAYREILGTMAYYIRHGATEDWCRPDGSYSLEDLQALANANGLITQASAKAIPVLLRWLNAQEEVEAVEATAEAVDTSVMNAANFIARLNEVNGTELVLDDADDSTVITSQQLQALYNDSATPESWKAAIGTLDWFVRDGGGTPLVLTEEGIQALDTEAGANGITKEIADQAAVLLADFQG